MSIESSLLNRLIEQPEEIVDQSPNVLYTLPDDQYKQLQLGALKTRFSQLYKSIPVLKRIADDQGITEIDSLEQAAPLLFQHTIYKSYPLSLIERSNFSRLTAWLNGFTALDLMTVDVSHIQSIDEWMRFMDEHTDLRIQHSTGTSGKLSFIPRSGTDRGAYSTAALSFYASFGEEQYQSPENKAFIVPSYRTGFNSLPRMLQMFVDAFDVPEDDIMTLFDHMNPDIMSLAGRLRQAEQKGTTDTLLQDENIQALRRQLIAETQNREEAFAKFFDNAIQRFGGRRIWMIGTIPQMYHAAKAGLDKGLSNVFHPESVVQYGGGMKGETLPENHLDVIHEFLGFDELRGGYGMTELMTFMQACPEGHYHVPPQNIVYLLDPDTGDLLPAHGHQTGRFGFIDLLPKTYWGGFLTGDEITVDWDHSCPCGRESGPLIHDSIQRLSEARGGDDKISCAGGADEAHDRAVEFLLKGLDDS